MVVGRAGAVGDVAALLSVRGSGLDVTVGAECLCIQVAWAGVGFQASISVIIISMT